MRPPRIAILSLFFAASLFLFCRSLAAVARHSTAAPAPAAAAATKSAASSQQKTFRSFFSFSTPFTLFPPNAQITLTDDNSTSFPARPAAFGPPLPATGLSGQLWIGSGFADDSLQDGVGGEFGCSDIPGWDNPMSDVSLKVATKGSKTDDARSAAAAGKTKNSKRGDTSTGTPVDRSTLLNAAHNRDPRPWEDGTDDYLHQSMEEPRRSRSDSTVSSSAGHADIQSMQEAAEIEGKVVLLSRGGCGFLEKVKWAQRRGAVAVIVGDNQKGGPLIQMFARGDTSNVSIPSIFTSKTSAMLLSSLMQPGSYIEDILDESGRPILKVQQSDKTNKNKDGKKVTKTDGVPKVTSTAKATKPLAKGDGQGAKEQKETRRTRRSWFSSLFGWGGDADSATEGKASPSGDNQDWVMVDEWSEAEDETIQSGLEKAAKQSNKDSASGSKDGFQIGVQDWRDPDLVDTKNTDSSAAEADETDAQDNQPAGLMSKLFGEGVDGEKKDQAKSTKPANSANSAATQQSRPEDEVSFEREGLWVTITPTSGASPFFDTLLVLVVSPLITLSVVYALLLLRARIRRRRWRAPKSVVDRLPVRTYHTVVSTPSATHSPRLPSPTSSSPTTPLLQQQQQQLQQQGSSRPRPRSRTTTGVPGAEDLLQVNSALQVPRSPTRAEKNNSPHISSEWKKYMGRQVECVVCLEEYVDGVSRVMSLPCGHEFHVECITPWLTTRRRTCPICKGDVVRSLARGSFSSPRYEPYRDDSEDEDLIASAAGSAPRTPSPEDRDVDLEQGLISPSPGRPRGPNRNDSGWFSRLSESLRVASSSRSRESVVSQEDRNR